MTAASFVVRADEYQGETMLPFASTLSAWNTTTEQFILLTDDDSPKICHPTAQCLRRHDIERLQP